MAVTCLKCGKKYDSQPGVQCPAIVNKRAPDEASGEMVTTQGPCVSQLWSIEPGAEELAAVAAEEAAKRAATEEAATNKAAAKAVAAVAAEEAAKRAAEDAAEERRAAKKAKPTQEGKGPE